MKFLFMILMAVLSLSVRAELIPLGEDELSEMTGQAFINIDRSSSSGFDFTKVSLGLDVKTSLNADLAEFGRYNRPGETNPSDIRISDFALGQIDNNGNIIPFEVRDPFIELAFDNQGGRENLVGVRLGFGGARGALSGNIESLTGNINVQIRDTAAGLSSANTFLGDLSAFLLANSPIETDAVLVNENGAPDAIRATRVGIANGERFNIIPTSGGDRFALRLATVVPGLNCVDGNFFICRHAQITSSNCEALGIATCFDLSNYNTLDVGRRTGPNAFDFAEGLFLSFQTQDVTWRDGTTTTAASSGAFLSVPNGGLQVTLQQAFEGTERARTKYVDPYYD